MARKRQLLDCSRLQKMTGSGERMGFRCQTSEDQVEIWLHGIVGDEWEELDSKSIGQVIASNAEKQITMRINSPGGLAYDGIAIYNALAMHSGPTTAIIEGLAGSAASLAAVGCDNVQCFKGAVFHPHYSLIGVVGHQADLREALELQQILDKDIEQIYADRSGQSLAKVQADLEGPNGDGTRFDAVSAQTAGYVDEIIEPPKRQKAHVTTAGEHLKFKAKIASYLDTPVRRD